MSSTSPKRFSCTPRIIPSAVAGSVPSALFRSVLIHPGVIALTRTPDSPHSIAGALVRLITAPLAAPCPRDPPVTSAFFPSRLKISVPMAVPSSCPMLRCPSVAGLVRVEAASGLTAEIPGVHQVLQQGRRSIAWIAELAVQRLDDLQRDVEPDDVRQRERSHRVSAAQLHRLVDVLGGRVARLQHLD